MDDLLKTQIHENCRFALPEGLKDLMWDISREVLRAQPLDLYKFITGYLSALLVTRENLSVAAHMCEDVCNNIYHLALDDELRYIGLSEKMANKVKKVIETHFSESKVNESNLLVKLVSMAGIQEDQLPEVQIAVRKAYLRHQAYRTSHYETSSSDSDVDDVDNAVRHTLHLYRHSKPSEEQYNKAAVNIQAAYRAYSLRRRREHCTKVKEELYDPNFQQGVDELSKEDVMDKDVQPTTNKSIRFDNKTQELYEITESTAYLVTASSTSLAGSHVNLPKYKPYSPHEFHDSEVLVKLEEVPEKEHSTIDYTIEESIPAYSFEETKPIYIEGPKRGLERKNISFHDIPSVIEDVALEAEEMSDCSIEEDIKGEINAEVDTRSYIAVNDYENFDQETENDSEINDENNDDEDEH